MHRHLLRIVLAMVASASLLSARAAQVQLSGGIRWFVRIADTDVTSEPRTFRIYGTPADLTTQLTISNESARVILVRPSALLDNVHFAVVAADPIAVTASLQDASAQPVSIDPGKGAAWSIELRRADGQSFDAARYTIRVDVTPSAWNARLLFAQTELTVVTGPPIPSTERVAALRQQGRRAMAEHRVGDAIAAYRLAVNGDPSNTVSLIALGDALSAAGRYTDAASVLARAEALVPFGEGSSVASKLAHAFVGANDDASAAAALRRAGIPEQRIAAELARLRRTIR
jgi:predicted Zn-dependent protease